MGLPNATSLVELRGRRVSSLKPRRILIWHDQTEFSETVMRTSIGQLRGGGGADQLVQGLRTAGWDSTDRVQVPLARGSLI